MEFLLLSCYVLLMLMYAGYSVSYCLNNGKVYIEKIILYGFSIIGIITLFFSTLGFSVTRAFWYIIFIIFIFNLILIIKFKVKFVKLLNSSIEYLSICIVLVLVAYPLIYFGVEFHSFYNFDFYFYSVISDWLLTHDITSRILDHHTLMDSVISASMRETMVTRIFTEFFTAFTTVLPAKLGYETRNLFMINHTIFIVLIPIMVNKLLNSTHHIKYFILIVSVNALFQFGYFYQLFPQTVGIVLSLWIIYEFKIFIKTNNKLKLVFAILILFITYPEITPIVLFPLVVSFFILKGLSKESLKNFIILLCLFFFAGLITCNYYFVDMFKFLIEQVFHGFQSNIEKGEILFPYYLNYSGIMSLFGLLTTPNDFSFITLGFNPDMISIVLMLYVSSLYFCIFKGLKDFYNDNMIVFSAFITYIIFFILFFILNKDFSTFKIAFLIQPYLMIALFYGLKHMKKRYIIYILLFPYIAFNLITSYTYSSMSINDYGTMKEIKGNVVSQNGSEFKNLIDELKNKKYNNSVFSTTLVNLTAEHWISYFLKNKEQAIPLIGHSLGKGKYNTLNIDTINTDQPLKEVDFYIMDETRNNTVLNNFSQPDIYEYKSNYFSIVTTRTLENFIISNRLTSPYLMEASMYKGDLENFPWYLFVDKTSYGNIGHLSRSADFYIVNPTKKKSNLVMAYSGYYSNNQVEKISIYNTRTNKILYDNNTNQTFTRTITKDFIPFENQEISYNANFSNNRMSKKQLSPYEFLNKSNPNFRNIVISLYQLSIVDEKDIALYKAPNYITIHEMLTNTLLPINGIYEDGWAVDIINTELAFDTEKYNQFTLRYQLPKNFKRQGLKIYIDNELIGNSFLEYGDNEIKYSINENMKSGTKKIKIMFENLNEISVADKRKSSLYLNGFGFSK